MATAYHNLSDYDFQSVPDASGMKFGIVVSEWNYNITGALLQGALNTLKKHGAKEEDILVRTVPGSFELIYGAHQMTLNGGYDAIIILGSVIRGETPHFDYICQGVSYGISQINASFMDNAGIISPRKGPVIFSVLTTLNKQQALERAGGSLGNKGVEGAITAIKMANLKI